MERVLVVAANLLRPADAAPESGGDAKQLVFDLDLLLLLLRATLDLPPPSFSRPKSEARSAAALALTLLLVVIGETPAAAGGVSVDVDSISLGLMVCRRSASLAAALWVRFVTGEAKGGVGAALLSCLSSPPPPRTGVRAPLACNCS